MEKNNGISYKYLIKSALIGFFVSTICIIFLAILAGVIEVAGPENSPNFLKFLEVLKQTIHAVSFFVSGYVMAKFAERKNVYISAIAVFILTLVCDSVLYLMTYYKIIEETKSASLTENAIHLSVRIIFIFIGAKVFTLRYREQLSAAAH